MRECMTKMSGRPIIKIMNTTAELYSAPGYWCTICRLRSKLSLFSRTEETKYWIEQATFPAPWKKSCRMCFIFPHPVPMCLDALDLLRMRSGTQVLHFGDITVIPLHLVHHACMCNNIHMHAQTMRMAHWLCDECCLINPLPMLCKEACNWHNRDSYNKAAGGEDSAQTSRTDQDSTFNCSSIIIHAVTGG